MVGEAEFNELASRYAELKHAADKVTRLYEFAGYRNTEMTEAMRDLQECLTRPLPIGQP